LVDDVVEIGRRRRAVQQVVDGVVDRLRELRIAGVAGDRCEDVVEVRSELRSFARP
jgi:hypothetical protein